MRKSYLQYIFKSFNEHLFYEINESQLNAFFATITTITNIYSSYILFIKEHQDIKNIKEILKANDSEGTYLLLFTFYMELKQLQQTIDIFIEFGIINIYLANYDGLLLKYYRWNFYKSQERCGGGFIQEIHDVEITKNKIKDDFNSCNLKITWLEGDPS